MITDTELFSVPGCKAHVLLATDQAELQDLLERCADYCLLVDGHPPRPSAYNEMLVEETPGTTVEDKLVLGFSTAEHGLIGVLDAMRNYPNKYDWWIGLLLLDPAQRSQGLGSLIYQAFEAWVKQRGARNVFLGVVEENKKALKFWRTVGFDVVERQAPRQFGQLSHVVLRMQRNLIKFFDRIK